MSWKAMWKNKNVRKCTSENCGCGTMSGYGIPVGMVAYHTTRQLHGGDHKKNKMGGVGGFSLKTPEYGRIMTQEQADQLDIETGRAVPGGRNTSSFTMSRAARKRGYVSKSYSYNANSKIEANGKTHRQNVNEFHCQQAEKWMLKQEREYAND